MKPLADAYNDERKIQFAKLGQLSDQINILDHQDDIIRRYPGSEINLPKLMSDFVEAYRERKCQENAFEFAIPLKFLGKFPTSPRGLSERFHEVMVDEYQDTYHIQERMLELLSNGHNRFMVEISSNLSTDFRQADLQIFNEKIQRYAQNLKRAS